MTADKITTNRLKEFEADLRDAADWAARITAAAENGLSTEAAAVAVNEIVSDLVRSAK